MATGMAHNIDAPKTMSREISETWRCLTNRSLFHFPNVPPGSFGPFDCHTSLRSDATVEVCRCGALRGEVER